MHRIVFAVHRQQFAPGCFCRSHHQLTRCDENFLVRKRDHLPELHRLVGRFQPNNANRSGNDQFRFRVGPHSEHSFAAMVNLRKLRHAFFAQQLRQVVGPLGVSHRNDLRLMPLDLACQFFQIRSGGQRDDAKTAGQRLHHRETLPPDRTGRTQNG